MLKIKPILLLPIALTVLGFPAQNKTLTPSQVQARLNIVNGVSTECVMHHFYTNSEWIQTEGEIGRNGIDGLYYKRKNNMIKEVLVQKVNRTPPV